MYMKFNTLYIEPNFEDSEINYLDCDSFFLSFKTKNIMKAFKNLKLSFDFNNPFESHELFSIVTKKDSG